MNSLNEKAVQAIIYGHSCAMKLKLRLDDPIADSGPVSSYDLVCLIVDCYSNAISFLTLKGSEDDQISDLSLRDSFPLPPTQKNHSKKRKINNIDLSEKWRDDSPNPNYYDGFLWRKYGEKCIKKSNHQRSYYRCSYNKDNKCPARKHEQKIKDNPPVYRTTYFGQHTCKTNHNQAEIHNALHDSIDDFKSVRMIRFGNDLDQEKENYSSDASLLVKDKEDINMIKEDINMIKEETTDESRHSTGDDQNNFQPLKEENQSSPSGSSGCESLEFDSDLLFDNIDLWAHYDQFDFGLVDFSAS